MTNIIVKSSRRLGPLVGILLLAGFGGQVARAALPGVLMAEVDTGDLRADFHQYRSWKPFPTEPLAVAILEVRLCYPGKDTEKVLSLLAGTKEDPKINSNNSSYTLSFGPTSLTQEKLQSVHNICNAPAGHVRIELRLGGTTRVLENLRNGNRKSGMRIMRYELTATEAAQFAQDLRGKGVLLRPHEGGTWTTDHHTL